MAKPFVRISLIFLLTVVLGAGLSVILVKGYFAWLAKETLNLSNTVVEIPYGSSLKHVAHLLAEQKIIPNEQQFYWYVRLARQDANRIQAGYYQFDGSYTYAQLAESLKNGRDRASKIIFKEGQTLVDLVNLLEAEGVLKKEDFIEAMRSKDVSALINAPNVEARLALENDVGGIEGYLFPDTYFFTKKDSPKTIISIMHRHLLNKIDESMRLRMKELNMSLHQVLSLASIVEKETGAPEERPVIASVYLNRLKIGMPLQADPTVIYGIKNYDGKIRKSDLSLPHPYNTYKIAGLPPGPIAAPSLMSIKAVLWPEETKYLYFVSKNDGSHIFCGDINCHNKAVKIWQIDFFKTPKKQEAVQVK